MRIADAPWLADLSRRVQHYGYRYSYSRRDAGRHAPAPAFPRWADAMAERLRSLFDGALPEQCIVNEYRPGQGIGMHADHATFGPGCRIPLAWGRVADAVPPSQRPSLCQGRAGV